MACSRRQPPPGTICHSDRGAIYIVGLRSPAASSGPATPGHKPGESRRIASNAISQLIAGAASWPGSVQQFNPDGGLHRRRKPRSKAYGRDRIPRLLFATGRCGTDVEIAVGAVQTFDLIAPNASVSQRFLETTPGAALDASVEDHDFFDGITMTTISVRIEKNSPRMPQPRALRPFMPAITAHTMAAMMLPIATKMPLIPLRMMPAASGCCAAARTTLCNMIPPP